MRVVNQGMISITPRESLGPDSEMVIGDEFGCGVLRPVTHSEGIDVSEDGDGDASEEEGFFPQLPAIRVMASGHTADLAQALGLGLLEELHVGPGKGGHGGAGALRLTQIARSGAGESGLLSVCHGITPEG